MSTPAASTPPPPYLRVEGLGAEGYVVRNHIDSDAIRRAVIDGWKATPSGWHHCIVTRTAPK